MDGTSDVCYSAKIRILKQITTGFYSCFVPFLTLFCRWRGETGALIGAPVFVFII